LRTGAHKDFYFLMNRNSEAFIRKIIIAIDGYSSCGKSTMAKALARMLGYRYIDSGAMYRAVTYFAQQHDLSLEQLQAMSDAQMHKLLSHIHITFRINPETGLSEVYLNDVNIEKKIRDLKVSEWVSPVSAIHAIRQHMVAKQQGYGSQKGLIMDGRDIGTKVFPHAELKIFMTARTDVRAKRRFDELNEKGFMVTMDEVRRNIEERDHMDTTRIENPLRQAEDAIVLDNSDMTEKEQLDFAMKLVERVISV
jgi:CMP/dCMP kinase